MPAKKHFLLILMAAFLLNAAAPVTNPIETEVEYRRMLDACRASACQDLPALLNNFGGFYFAQARYAQAEPLLREAASLNHDEQLALTLSNLASLYRVTGRFEEAVPLFDRAVRMLEELNPNGSQLPVVLTRAAMLALDVRANMEDVVQGETRCRRALTSLDANSAEAGTAHNTLAAILETLGRFTEAGEELDQALALRQHLLAPDDPLVAETLNKLGLIHRHLGHMAEAESLYRKALAILRSHPPAVELGTALNNLGNLQAARGRLDEADSTLREAITVWEKLLGPEHPNIAAALTNLSSVARMRHHYAEAERLLTQALDMDRKLLPASHIRIGLGLNNAGTLLAARKRYPDAEAALRESLEILRKGLPAQHPEIGRTLVNLGEVLRLENKPSESRERYREGIQILTRAWGADDARLLNWLGPYAVLSRAQQDYAEAAKADMQAMKIRVKDRGKPVAY